MFIRSMLHWPVFGLDPASYGRLMWCAYGQLVREQHLNQRALAAWWAALLKDQGGNNGQSRKSGLA